MKKRLLACMLAGVMAVSALAGCGSTGNGGQEQSAAPEAESAENTEEAEAPAADNATEDNAEAETNNGEKTVITFWNGFTGSDRETLEALVKEYNETNDKNIEVQMDIMPWDSFYQKLATALPVGEGPDILAMATERIGSYADPGALAAVDDIYSSGIVDETVVPETLKENLKYDGKYYGVPMNFATLLLYYNKTIFEEAGLDPEKAPETWEELEQYAQQIVEKTGKYGFDMAVKDTTPMWCIMLWGNGGDIIKDGKAVFNSPENVETVTRWAENIRDKKFGPEVLTGGEIDKLFESQKLAMYFCGPWATNGFTNAGIDYGVAQAPKGPKEQVTQANAVGMYMTSSSKNKEAVYDFFGWWNSKDTQVKWSLGTGFPPARTDIADDERMKENPYIAEFAKPANESKMYLQQLTNFAEVDTQAIVPAFEKILLENADVQEALDEANAVIESLIQ
ncbi:MAG: ABC transporter substrate-binding protein [Kineothrix sp.]|jgi:multiple sugar transport system substrate-binding protein|nr:hypothetical protein C807_01132 [Lachnospiraceae bacterium 28-4]MCI8846333.1 ABC transporter substrate-binding protein [Lachnospiraceae bacterium]MCX4342761.1 ABC transporter substrate-binding protein [Kineothrix sp.]